jgi:hypothetical protein
MTSLVRSAIKGAVGGALGTLAMDLVWYRRFRRGGGAQPFIEWETSDGTQGYEGAGAPARTAKAVGELIGVELPDSSARMANNFVHWATGIAWGKGHGVAARVVGTTNPLLGVGTAVVAWAASYAVLPKLGVYKQITEYDSDVLWQDLSAHLVYGAVLGVTYRLISSRP